MRQADEFVIVLRIGAQTADGDGHTALKHTVELRLRTVGFLKVMQELLNYASREDFNTTGDNLAGFLKNSGNTALEKKWENVRNKLAEPYEIKANTPKMEGSNKAVVDYDVYGYDEGKIAEMIDQNIEQFVQELTTGFCLPCDWIMQ